MSGVETEKLLEGDRGALARAITLVESTRADHQAAAEELLTEVMSRRGASLRVGISGTPGVGKSTFIDAFGTYLTARGHKVAVLAVDPSSVRSGGSILGDKTRMERLGRDDKAFVRPSPTSGELGGVARRTRETILLCEAAGFDVIVVETVGVGQSEIAVAEMVDAFLLLLAPGGGDELQGIKRGIMELADVVVVNKADSDLLPAARRAAAEYQSALNFMRPRFEAWSPEVVQVSSIEETGIDAVWDSLGRFRKATVDSGEFDAHRRRQARAWLWTEIRDQLLDALRADPGIADALETIEAQVGDGLELPPVAARRLLTAFRRTT